MKDVDEVDVVCNTGFSDPPDEEITPSEYFKQMCRDEVVENFVEQSNLYCVQKTGRPLNTNKNEMEQFLGTHIMAGIVKLPSHRMYWADSTRFDLIADVMSRNRVDTMSKYFHINDNDTMKARDDPEYDKLFKVRPFVESIKSSFREIEVRVPPNSLFGGCSSFFYFGVVLLSKFTSLPESKISFKVLSLSFKRLIFLKIFAVEELIIPFKGQSSLKQYVRNKPHKWGKKVFARAGSNGIAYDFEVYLGKGTVQNVPLKAQVET
jgi:hypothetical protein